MNCDEIRDYFIDYLDGSISAEDKETVDAHIEGCAECKSELLKLKSVIDEIDMSKEEITIPEDFMINVENRVNKINFNNKRKRKNPIRVILIAAVILTMSVATVFAVGEPILELIKYINPETRVNEIVNKGFGSYLNMSKVDKDIKITITDVVADDIQTLISYKIEDLKNGEVYKLNYDKGINIKEKWGKISEEIETRMYTALFDHGGKGTITLYPIDTEEKTIHLSLNKLYLDKSEIKTLVEGNWDFEVPIKKHHGKTYDINTTVKADNYTIDFTKINISPTLTTLYFNCRGGNPPYEKILGLEDLRIVANGKEYKPYNFGHQDWNAYSPVGYGNDKMTFETMFFDNPKNIEIKISRISTQIKEEIEKEFIIKLDEVKPQEFEYGGARLTVESLKIGEEIKFDLKQSFDNRQFETINYDYRPLEDYGKTKHFSGFGNYTELYYIDKNNNKYEYYDALSKWEDIRTKRPEIYISKTSQTLKPSEGFNIKKEKAIKMVIEAYTKTVFVDKSVKVRLK